MTESSSVRAKVARPAWIEGMVRAVPIVLGYIPIGFAYGVLAQQADLSVANTLLMSVMVYAGSSQLIAVGLFAQGVPALSIIITTFVVNLRHMLFSAALSPYLKRWSKGVLAAFAYELTDETFALHSVMFPHAEPRGETSRSKPTVFAINVTAQLSWILGTGLGIVAGRYVTDVRPLALDFTLPAMFIALLVVQLRGRVDVVVALCGGVGAVGLTLVGLDRWSVILSTVIAATLGVMLERGFKATAPTDEGSQSSIEAVL
jgi:4-azaleucine resistance transporter AzlC